MLKNWRVVSASVCGSSHLRLDRPCQDRHFWAMPSKGVLVAAVADGAGSAPLSEFGAEIAAHTAVKVVAEAIAPLPKADEEAAWKDLLIEALRTARYAVEAEAEIRGVPPSDLATTLILLVTTPDVTAVAQIGDGAAIFEDEGGALHALTTPQNGEYANETTFLVSPNALEKVQTTVQPICAHRLALFSDGLQRIALRLADGTPFPQFFAPLFRFVEECEELPKADEQLAEFLGSPRVSERTDDDVTLLLACNVSSKTVALTKR